MGDSCFPGQGVIAVAFSGVMCAHRVAADLGQFFEIVSHNLVQYPQKPNIGLHSHKVDLTLNKQLHQIQVVFDAVVY